MGFAIYLDDFCSEPGEKECWNAIWSQGRECKRCNAKCYRKGWEKWRVDADNKEIVKRNCSAKQ